ncbi:MAG: hypothetical protein HYX34_03210 [Actinobacteria bacterium]|nr:hypothetical protein [Actinomycetota bacterium]
MPSAAGPDAARPAMAATGGQTSGARPPAASVASRGRWWRRLALSLGWIVALLAVLWALTQLGTGALSTPPLLDRPRLSRWLGDRDAMTVAFAFLRLVAVVLTWYLIATTVLGVLARATRVPALVRLADLATVPAVRRLLGGIAGVGLTASAATLVVTSASGSTRATPSPAVAERAADLAAPGAVVLERLPDGGSVVLERLPDDGTATMRVVGEIAGSMAHGAPRATWTAEPGDHLWHIAEATLEQRWGRAPSETEVVPYWQAVVDANRTRLVDRDNPDLIYPGQVFTLPPAPPPPPGRGDPASSPQPGG